MGTLNRFFISGIFPNFMSSHGAGYFEQHFNKTTELLACAWQAITASFISSGVPMPHEIIIVFHLEAVY